MQQDLFCASLHVKINVFGVTKSPPTHFSVMSVFDFFFFFFCFSYHGISVLMYAKMPQNSVSVHLCSFSIPSNLWLVPSCSALPSVCFPFTGVPPSLPSLFAEAFFWSLSPLLDKEWHGQKREEEEDGGMSNSVSCCYCQNIALAFFVFSAYLVQNSWLFQ